MKFQTLCITALTALSFTACTLTPKKLPSGELATAFVIEQHKDISAEPQTDHNLARLIKQSENCDIEFTAYFQTGKATEHWLFKGDQLISAFSNVETETEKKQIIFDLNEEKSQSNFQALKKNFSKSKLDKCTFETAEN